jgi:hypothetical protein
VTHRARKSLVWLAAFSLLALLLAACESGVDKNLEKAAAEVCNGGSLPNAVGYAPGKGEHPLVVYQLDSKQSIPVDDYPQNILPKRVNDLQLVACVVDEWKTVETCKYHNTSNTIEIQQNHKIISVIAAKTGEKLAALEVWGGSYSPCPLKVYKNDFSSHKIFMTDSSEKILDQVKAWLDKE